MKIPEKIYLYPYSTDGIYEVETKPLEGTIEYIRADALIEKAVAWFKNNWREYVNTDKDGVVCFGHWENDFRKYMEE